MKKRQKNSFGNNTSIVLIVTVLVVIVGCVIGYYLYKKNKNVTTTTKPVTKTTTKPGTKTTTKPVTKTTSKPNSPSSLQGQNCISLDPNSVTSSYDSTGKCIIQTCKSDYTLTNNTCQQKTCSVLDPNATSNIGYIINGNCIPQSCKHYYSVSGTFCQPEHCKPLDPLAADGTYNSSGACEVTACSSSSFGVIENNSICVSEYTGEKVSNNNLKNYRVINIQGNGHYSSNTGTFVLNTDTIVNTSTWKLTQGNWRFRTFNFNTTCSCNGIMFNPPPPANTGRGNMGYVDGFPYTFQPVSTNYPYNPTISGNYYLTDDNGNKFVDASGNSLFDINDKTLHVVPVLSNTKDGFSIETKSITLTTLNIKCSPPSVTNPYSVGWNVNVNINITI